jgi:phage repressor protein C with HTH and peptisase S24 domain
MVETLAERIQQRLEILGISEQAASLKATGKKDTIRMIRTGRTQSPRSDTLAALAKALETTEQWLLRGDETSAVAPKPTRNLSDPMPVPDVRSLPRDLPVLGTASGSVFGNVGGAWQLAGDAAGYIRRPPMLAGVNGAYALYVENDSMLPKYEPGDPVYVHPKQPPRGGDDVIIQVLASEHAEPETFIKRLIRQNGQTVVCRQFNPLQDIEFTRKYVQVLHRVVPYRELMGF